MQPLRRGQNHMNIRKCFLLYSKYGVICWILHIINDALCVDYMSECSTGLSTQRLPRLGLLAAELNPFSWSCATKLGISLHCCVTALSRFPRCRQVGSEVVQSLAERASQRLNGLVTPSSMREGSRASGNHASETSTRSPGR